MDFPGIVDIGLGLIVVYISASLMVSGAQETIASLFQWRSSHLRESILQIILGASIENNDFNRANQVREAIYASPLIQSMNHVSIFWVVNLWDKILHLFQSLFNRSLLKDDKLLRSIMTKDQKIHEKLRSKKFPSYIDRETFSTALLDTVCKLNDANCELGVSCKLAHTVCRDKTNCQLSEAEKTQKTEERKELENTLDQLQSVLRKTTNLNDDIQDIVVILKKGIIANEKLPQSLQDILTALMIRATTKVKDGEAILLSFQREIENWFDASMVRASGVYKRNTQIISLVLAWILVIFFNLDSLHIARRLQNDSTLRTILADSASSLVANYQLKSAEPSSQIDLQQLEENMNQIFDSSLPILPIYENAANLMNCPDRSDCPLLTAWQQGQFDSRKFFSACIGWMLTVLAIYMGAPFWFDLLNKLVNLRSTGSPPK